MPPGDPVQTVTIGGARGAGEGRQTGHNTNAYRRYETEADRHRTGVDADGDGIDDGVAAYMDSVDPTWRSRPDAVQNARSVYNVGGYSDSGEAGTPIDALFDFEGTTETQTAEEAALDQLWSDLKGDVPTTDEMRARSEGYSPTMEADTAMAGAAADPLAIEAQRRALAGLGSELDRRGMDAIDRSALGQAMDMERMTQRAQRGQVAQMAAARGMRGGGMDVAGTIGGQQASAARLGQAGSAIEAEAQRRALSNIAAYGALGGDVRGQSFGERSRIAGAQDAISERNLGRENEARRFGAQSRNRAALQNAGIADRWFGMRSGIAAGEQGRLDAAEAERERQRQASDQARKEAYGALTTGGTTIATSALDDDDEDEEDERRG